MDCLSAWKYIITPSANNGTPRTSNNANSPTTKFHIPPTVERSVKKENEEEIEKAFNPHRLNNPPRGLVKPLTPISPMIIRLDRRNLAIRLWVFIFAVKEKYEVKMK